MTVDIDREKAAVYGVTVDQVRNQLYNAYGARQVGTIYMPSNDYQIILEAQPQFRVDPSSLSKLYLKTDKGQTIPLDAVAKRTVLIRRERRGIDEADDFFVDGLASAAVTKRTREQNGVPLHRRRCRNLAGVCKRASFGSHYTRPRAVSRTMRSLPFAM